MIEDVVRSSNVDAVEVIQVIHVESILGGGEDGEPIRHISEYFTMDGTFLARRDAWLESTRVYNTGQNQEKGK